MKETQKKHAKPVFPNGFVLRLSAAFPMTAAVVAFGIIAAMRAGGASWLILLTGFTVYAGLQIMAAIVGKKHAWANYLCIVLSAPLVVVQGYGVLGIVGGMLGNKFLKAQEVQDRSDGILDKVVNARGKTANEQVFKELLACMKKKDDAAFQAIVDRENAFYESVKDIMFTPDEAKTACARLCNMATVLEGKPAAKTLRGEWKSMYEERDFAKLRAVLSEYEPRYDAWIRKNVNGVPSDYVPEMDGEGGFDGRVIQRFGWQLLCRFVDLITLMIAKPFTICWMMRWECKHTVYKGKRLSFDGNGLQLWGKYMLWWLLSVITLGIYSFFVAVRLEKWKAKHTHLAGEIAAFGGGFDGWVIQQVGWRLLCSLVNCLTLFIAFPATLCWMEKWKFKHRIYDGVRLRFNGNGIQLFGKWLLWLLLSVVTLGIYAIFLPIKINDWKAKHVELSTEREFLG